MFSNDDQSGLFTFLVGMIILVMAGVVLSLLVDRRFKFSTGIGELRREIAVNASDLLSLAATREERLVQLSLAGKSRVSESQHYQELTAKADELKLLQNRLVGKQRIVAAGISSLENEFAEYRADYRRHAWTRAVGEKLGDLSVPGRRRYVQVVITRVTDVGLEIRHGDGIARIKAADLDRAFHDRFQWSDEERRQRRRKERDGLLVRKKPEIEVGTTDQPSETIIEPDGGM